MAESIGPFPKLSESMRAALVAVAAGPVFLSNRTYRRHFSGPVVLTDSARIPLNRLYKGGFVARRVLDRPRLGEVVHWVVTDLGRRCLAAQPADRVDPGLTRNGQIRGLRR